MPVEPRRRRRLRFGIGGLMLAILLFGLWLGDRVNRAKQQRRAVEAVKASGGWVHYADEFAMGSVKVPPGNAIWKPGWGTLASPQAHSAPGRLRRWLGDDYVREVVHVSLFVDIQKGIAGAPGPNERPVDEVLELLEGQSTIRTLQMGGETITDKGLASVSGMTDLRELFIWWALGITDDGMAHLARLPRLKLVDISLSGLTDEGVRHLAEIPMLEELSLEGRKFTDRSLLHLARAKHLKTLMLRSNAWDYSDEGLKHLEGLKELRRLRLSGFKPSEGAKARLLKALPNLEIAP